MSTELVYRLRTCAAAILAVDPKSGWVALVTDDAANLLIEAANVLDVPEELGEPMEVLKTAPIPQRPTAATWGTDLPSIKPQPCPSCGDATSARTARRDGRRLMLTCPKCASTWEYGK